jgi:hypothetical protein
MVEIYETVGITLVRVDGTILRVQKESVKDILCPPVDPICQTP